MAETKLAMSLDALIQQATKKKDRKPAPRQAAPAGQSPQSGPRKGLNRNRQKNNANANGAPQPQQRPPKQQQQQQQSPQQQQQQQRQPTGGQRNRKGGAANLGVRGGQVQKLSVIEVPARALRSAPPLPAPAPAPPRNRGYQQRQPAPEGKWQHDMYIDDYAPPRRAPVQVAAASTSTKLIVKNLHHQVSEDDLLELFSTCGTVKSHGINFDTSGRSLSTGWVVFETRKEAEVAKKEYDKVKLDGQAMSISFPEEAAAGAPLKKLSSGIVVQKPGGGGGGGAAAAGGGGGGPQARGGGGGQRLAAAAIRETAAASRGAGGRGGGGSRGGRLRSAVVGRSQLDADLQDYMQE